MFPWDEELSAAITVADENGIIVHMNAKARQTFASAERPSLVGYSLFDCHPEPSCTKLRKLYQEQASNAYTIEKNGIKKLIYQSPWYKEGKFAGFVEMSMQIPLEMPHFIRSPKEA